MIAYSSAWENLLSFLKQLGLPSSPPIDPKHISLYLAHLHALGKGSGYAKAHLSAIAFNHKMKELPDPTKTFIISRIIKSFEKRRPLRRQRTPITIKVLRRLLPTLNHICPSRYISLLLTAIFTLMYAACLRIGEVAKSNHNLHTLRIENLLTRTSPSNEKEYLLLLPSYKHSKAPAKLLLAPSPDKRTCPVRAIRKFLNVRPRLHGQLFILEDGKPATRYHIHKYLTLAITRAGLDPTHFNTHSFRAGRASDLAIAGASEQLIRETGRWHSNAFLNYLKFELFSLPRVE